MMNRRSILHTALALPLLAGAPRALFAAAPTDRRLVFVLLRGGMDGLNMVIPYAEPAYATARRQLAILPADGAIKLDGSFALHPALTAIASLYQAREALFCHAVATPYRERSHFDAQNILETGGLRAYAHNDGWLNRLLGLLAGPPALAIGQTVPVALKGANPVTSFAPSRLPDSSAGLLDRVAMLYESDPQLGPLWAQAAMAQDIGGGAAMSGGPMKRADGADIAALVGRFLARADGPGIAMVELDGWDTHVQQPARLTQQARQLDALLGGLKPALGPAWAGTLVIVVSEFGRTVAANGTGGTDHGTGGLAVLAGGAVQGGRVLADWPGLTRLHEGRDLQPTTDLFALIAGAIAAQYRIEPSLVARTLTPGAHGMRPLEGLLRA